MKRAHVGLVLTALAFAAGGLEAQKAKTAPKRGGQWLGFGLGAGIGRVGCETCDATRGAVSGYLKAGGTLSRRWLVGLELDGWLHGGDPVDEYLLGLAADFYFYPNPKKRISYKAGLGVMRYQADDGPGRVTATAFGANFGVAYDIPMSKAVSWAPFASAFVASPGGSIKFNGENVRDDVSLMLIQLGVGVTWH